jgi:hypothetical protein
MASYEIRRKRYATPKERVDIVRAKADLGNSGPQAAPLKKVPQLGVRPVAPTALRSIKSA